MGDAKKYVTMLIFGLVAFVVAVPVLGAIFSSGGAFADLNAFVGSGSGNSIENSTYRPILAAIFGLIPLGLMLSVGWYFISWHGQRSGGGGGKKRSRRTRRRRSSRRRTAPTGGGIPGPGGFGPGIG